MELRNEAYNNTTPGTYQFEQDVIDAWRNDGGRNPLLYPNTDWVEEISKQLLQPITIYQ